MSSKHFGATTPPLALAEVGAVQSPTVGRRNFAIRSPSCLTFQVPCTTSIPTATNNNASSLPCATAALMHSAGGLFPPPLPPIHTCITPLCPSAVFAQPQLTTAPAFPSTFAAAASGARHDAVGAGEGEDGVEEGRVNCGLGFGGSSSSSSYSSCSSGGVGGLSILSPVGAQCFATRHGRQEDFGPGVAAAAGPSRNGGVGGVMMAIGQFGRAALPSSFSSCDPHHHQAVNAPFFMSCGVPPPSAAAAFGAVPSPAASLQSSSRQFLTVTPSSSATIAAHGGRGAVISSTATSSAAFLPTAASTPTILTSPAAALSPASFLRSPLEDDGEAEQHQHWRKQQRAATNRNNNNINNKKATPTHHQLATEDMNSSSRKHNSPPRALANEHQEDDVSPTLSTPPPRPLKLRIDPMLPSPEILASLDPLPSKKRSNNRGDQMSSNSKLDDEKGSSARQQQYFSFWSRFVESSSSSSSFATTPVAGGGGKVADHARSSEGPNLSLFPSTSRDTSASAPSSSSPFSKAREDDDGETDDDDGDAVPLFLPPPLVSSSEALCAFPSVSTSSANNDSITIPQTSHHQRMRRTTETSSVSVSVSDPTPPESSTNSGESHVATATATSAVACPSSSSSSRSGGGGGTINTVVVIDHATVVGHCCFLSGDTKSNNNNTKGDAGRGDPPRWVPSLNVSPSAGPLGGLQQNQNQSSQQPLLGGSTFPSASPSSSSTAPASTRVGGEAEDGQSENAAEATFIAVGLGHHLSGSGGGSSSTSGCEGGGGGSSGHVVVIDVASQFAEYERHAMLVRRQRRGSSPAASSYYHYGAEEAMTKDGNDGAHSAVMAVGGGSGSGGTSGTRMVDGLPSPLKAPHSVAPLAAAAAAAGARCRDPFDGDMGDYFFDGLGSGRVGLDSTFAATLEEGTGSAAASSSSSLPQGLVVTGVYAAAPSAADQQCRCRHVDDGSYVLAAAGLPLAPSSSLSRSSSVTRLRAQMPSRLSTPRPLENRTDDALGHSCAAACATGGGSGAAVALRCCSAPLSPLVPLLANRGTFDDSDRSLSDRSLPLPPPHGAPRGRGSARTSPSVVLHHHQQPCAPPPPSSAFPSSPPFNPLDSPTLAASLHIPTPMSSGGGFDGMPMIPLPVASSFLLGGGGLVGTTSAAAAASPSAASASSSAVPDFGAVPSSASLSEHQRSSGLPIFGRGFGSGFDLLSSSSSPTAPTAAALLLLSSLDEMGGFSCPSPTAAQAQTPHRRGRRTPALRRSSLGSPPSLPSPSDSSSSSSSSSTAALIPTRQQAGQQQQQHGGPTEEGPRRHTYDPKAVAARRSLATNK